MDNHVAVLKVGGQQVVEPEQSQSSHLGQGSLQAVKTSCPMKNSLHKMLLVPLMRHAEPWLLLGSVGKWELELVCVPLSSAAWPGWEVRSGHTSSHSTRKSDSHRWVGDRKKMETGGRRGSG